MTAMSQIVVTPQPVPLGKSGILVSPIAWGMWRFAGATLGHAHALVETALDAGITLFDTAGHVLGDRMQTAIIPFAAIGIPDPGTAKEERK